MKTVRLVLLTFGLAVLGYLVSRVGPETVLASFRTLSWRLLLVLVFPYAVIATLHTLGWRFAFPRDPASFATLFSVRLAGEALNVATPAISIGGEPVKAVLLRRCVPLSEGLAAVIVDKTTITAAQGLFLAVGLALAWLLRPVPSTFLVAMLGLLVVEVLALGGFALVQLLGVFGRGLDLVTQQLGLAWRGYHAEKFRRLERALAAFYRRHARRAGMSLLFHFLGWLLGGLELYLVLHFLGIPISPVAALVIEAVGTSIRFMAFMIPTGLGVLEGGMMAVFAAVGLDPGLGLSQTLIRRLRELAWVAAGLAVLVLVEPFAPEAGT